MVHSKAVLWDFGGVILESPFDAFASYERANSLPEGFLRGLNATNPDTNAWAHLERSAVSMGEFCTLFEAEAEAAGHRIDARGVLALLSGRVRPEMVEAVRICAARLPTGLVTNNFVGFGDATDGPHASSGDPVSTDASRDPRPDVAEALSLFHVIIESSKVGMRKPDPRIYELACEALGVTPSVTVFLDDLGINLKPARALGMKTIKVVDPGEALRELESAVGFPVRAV